MLEESYKKAIKGIEANFFKYDFQYAEAFQKVFEDNEDVLTDTQKEALRREVVAFRLVTIDTTQERECSRLQPMATYADGSAFPDIATISKEDLNYYLKRSKQTSNPVMKLRYLDIVWELGKQARNKIGPEIVGAAIETAGVATHANELDQIDALNRALQVSLMLGKTGQNLKKRAIEAITSKLKELKAEENLRYALELVETVVNYSDHFQPNHFELCDSVCEMGIAHYTEENDNYVLRGHFIERQYDLKKLLNPEKDDLKERARRLAESHIAEAERRTDSIIVQQHFLSEAQKILYDAGLKDEAHKLGLRIEKLGKDPKFEKEFKHVSVTQEIPRKAIEQLEGILKKYEDTCAVIAVNVNFAPSWAKAREAASEQQETFISDMLTRVIYDKEGLPVARTSQDAQHSRVMRYFQIDTELKLTILAELLRKLIEGGVITQKNFEFQFEKIRHIDEPTWLSIQHGLKLFLEGDHYSASLILVTQLEDLIFRLLPTKEISQYRQTSDGTYMWKTLTPMLKSIKGFVGEDLYRLLHYTLVDNANVNARHRAAHGKIKITEDNFSICVRVIQLYASLFLTQNIEENKDSDDNSN